MVQLFLDCDGVLADFDRGATELLGMAPREYQRRYGSAAFWSRLAKAPGGFYANLPLLPDAMVLFGGVRDLDPIILTGLPRGGWAAEQKMRWAAEHFPGVRIITCMAVDKRNHSRPGDILVDDTLTHRRLWEGAGGLFIHHRSAVETLAELRARFPALFRRRAATPNVGRALG